jgi:serine/threonine protein kinase
MRHDDHSRSRPIQPDDPQSAADLRAAGNRRGQPVMDVPQPIEPTQALDAGMSVDVSDFKRSRASIRDPRSKSNAEMRRRYSPQPQSDWQNSDPRAQPRSRAQAQHVGVPRSHPEARSNHQLIPQTGPVSGPAIREPMASPNQPTEYERPSAGAPRTGSSRSAGVAEMRRGSKPTPTPSKRTGPRTPRALNDRNIGRELGSYRIVSLLGAGGMGQVYKAEHTKIGREVALKLLRPEYAAKRDAVHRFFQEARAVNAIGHENIVDITDYVELDSGETFFIMELLQGQDLADILRGAATPMPLHRAMQIALQVCEALVAAHATGIIHRDLKPDNIFIVEAGSRHDYVKLLDFGVAKLQGGLSGTSSYETAAGSVIGTPAYMSPEQASGIPVDARSDIYSLGAILYEMFTGHPVFRAKSFGEFVVKHMNDQPVAPRDLADAPRIPIALEQVILRCLEKDPNKRYQSVEELREDLARATATVETTLRNLGVQTPRSRRKLFVIPIALALVGLAVGAFWIAAGLTVDDIVEDPPKSKVPSKPPARAKKSSVPIKLATTPSPLVEFHTRPKGADIVLVVGDKRTALGTTPLRISPAKLGGVGANVTIEFKREGFKTRTIKLTVSDSSYIDEALDQADSTRDDLASATAKKDVARVAVKKSHRKTKRRRYRNSKRRHIKRKRRDPQKSTKTPQKTKSGNRKINRTDQVDPFAD